ncbi:MAG: hypothetical protein H6Q32_389, partial [Bacteroidetes bacterium]|nr:hypothetical protein [Bacteroidota bacterium]
MNVFRSLAVLLPVLTLSGAAVRAQDGDTFDLQAYRAFLVAHKDLTAEGLGTLHPAGTFLRTTGLPSTQIAFYEQV